MASAPRCFWHGLCLFIVLTTFWTDNDTCYSKENSPNQSDTRFNDVALRSDVGALQPRERDEEPDETKHDWGDHQTSAHL